MKKCIFVLFTIFFSIELFSMDFEQLKAYTLKNSKQLKVKKIDNFISEKELDIIKSENYPEISVGFNMESSNSFDESNNSTSVGGDTLSNDSLQKSYSYVNMNYNLYSFGRLESKIKIQEYQLQSVKYEYCLEEKNIITTLLEHYYNARNTQVSEEYLSKIIELKNKLFTYNNKLYNLGDISKLDLMKSSIDVAEIYSQISENKKKNKEYKRLISNVSGYFLQSDENLEALFTDEIKNKKNFENTINSKVLKSQIKAKKAELQLFKNEFNPNLNFYSKYDIYGSDASSFKQSLRNMQSNSYKFGVSLSWNVFNGYKTSSQKEKTLLELRQLQHKYDLEEDKFETQVDILNQNYELDKLNLKNKNQSLELALINEEYSSRLNNVGELSKPEQINFEIDKYYKKLDYITNKERIAYEYIKKAILLEEEKCIVH